MSAFSRDLPQVKHAGKSLYESLILTESVRTPKEARQMIHEGKVFLVTDLDLANETQTPLLKFNYRLKQGDIIRVGKRKFIQIS